MCRCWCYLWPSQLKWVTQITKLDNYYKTIIRQLPQNQPAIGYGALVGTVSSQRSLSQFTPRSGNGGSTWEWKHSTQRHFYMPQTIMNGCPDLRSVSSVPDAVPCTRKKKNLFDKYCIDCFEGFGNTQISYKIYAWPFGISEQTFHRWRV